MKFDNTDLFVNEKPCKVLVAIKKLNNRSNADLDRINEGAIVSNVASKIDTTYAHGCKLISKLEDQGYIISKSKGRKKFLELTDQGKDLANIFEEIIDLDPRDTSGLMA